MIHVDRSRVPMPEVLTSDRAAKARAAAESFFRRPQASRLQERHVFDAQIWRECRPALFELFRGACAYCETPISQESSGDIELFRPETAYWWLAYDWENLYVTCAECNKNKRDQFPIAGK